MSVLHRCKFRLMDILELIMKVKFIDIEYNIKNLKVLFNASMTEMYVLVRKLNTKSHSLHICNKTQFAKNLQRFPLLVCRFFHKKFTQILSTRGLLQFVCRYFHQKYIETIYQGIHTSCLQLFPSKLTQILSTKGFPLAYLSVNISINISVVLCIKS